MPVIENKILAEQFSAALRAGETPDIDEFVRRAASHGQEQLRRELTELLEQDAGATRTRETVDSPLTTGASNEIPALCCPACGKWTLEVVNQHERFECRNTSCGSVFSLKPFGEPKLASVSHFDIVGLIGEGGFGRVWFARSQIDQKYVALKIPKRAMHRDRIDQFIREIKYAYEVLSDARTIGKIPQLIASGRDGLASYIAFEFISGAPLDKHPSSYPLAPLRAAKIASEVARTLQIAHDHGLVHRDVKPSNILLSGDRPYLCDFGLSREFLLQERSELSSDTCFAGTFAYASPEHDCPDQLSATSDVFSLGIVLFEMLAGVRPFRGQTPLQTFELIVSPSYCAPLLSQVKQGIDPELVAICNKCLRKNPRDRYQSAGELADALDRYIIGASGTVKLRRSNLLKFTSAILLVVVVAVAIAFAARAFPDRWPPNEVAWVLDNDGSFIFGSDISSPISSFKLGDESVGNWTTTIPERRRAVVAINFDYYPARRHINNQNIEFLLAFKGLRGLLLNDCADITNDCGTVLNQLDQLQTLQLRSPYLNESVLSQLDNLSELRELTLPNNCRLDEADVWRRFPKLEYLCAYYASHISDEAARALAKHPRLADLELPGSKISNSAIVNLLNSQSLIELLVDGSNIDKKKLTEILDACPGQLREFGISPTRLQTGEIIESFRSAKNPKLDFFVVPSELADSFSEPEKDELLTRFGTKLRSR